MKTSFALERRMAEALAREAGHRVVRERRQGLDVSLKSRNDVVTNVDHSIERFITGELAALFPEDRIVGEEFGEGEGEGRRCWLIDPIDGTLNFAQGVPLFTVSIALQAGGHTVAGAVYDPSRDELFSASKGEGCWLDGERVGVSECEDLGAALLVTGFPPVGDEEGAEDNLGNFVHMMRAARSVRRLGSAALDLAYVACGRLEGFWEYYLKPWDTAAGYLLVEEAGGQVSPVEHEARYTAHEGSVLASNGRLHEAICVELRRARPL